METKDNSVSATPTSDEKKSRRENSEVGVETGTEATEPDHDIAELTRDMFNKMTAYIRGDLATTAEDYKLLEDMNRMTSKKYDDMKQMACEISSAMKSLDDKYKNLEPYLAQVDQIEESVLSLEHAALRLDAYARRLEAKFKHLEKRIYLWGGSLKETWLRTRQVYLEVHGKRVVVLGMGNNASKDIPYVNVDCCN